MSRDEALLNELKQAVLDNLENDQFSVEQLSHMVGVSRSHLHRRLKKLKGQSISQFIREVKLTQALQLLRKDVATTSEIAFRVGFNSPSYFHKCFLEYYGYPPSEVKTTLDAFTDGGGSKEHTEWEEDISPSLSATTSVARNPLKYVLIALTTLTVFFLAFLSFYFLGNRVSAPMSERSIAVLPFNNLSDDKANQHFADGLVEDLLIRLALIKEFRVISWTSSSSYREQKDKTVPEIAERLGVRFIVEGSVQRHNDTVRVAVQLIDAEKDDHMWVRTFDEDIGNIFSVQSDIAVQLASGLSTFLTKEQTIEIQRNRTESVKALEWYHLGRHHWGMRSLEGLRTSITYFEKAIAEDPNYAVAYAGLADSYYLMVWFDDKDNQAYNRGKALELATRSLEIDNRLTEGYTVLATVYSFVDWNWAEAEKIFLQGLEHNPNFANIHHRYSEHLSITGRPDEARLHINRALELDPLSFIVRHVSVAHYFDQGLFKEALVENQICSDLILNKFHWYVHDMNFNLYCQLGRGEDALENLKELNDRSILELDPHLLDSIYQASGHRGLARWYAGRQPNSFEKARVYGLGGADEQAMKWLEIAFDDREASVGFPVMYEFRNLSTNPRFIALLEKMNLPWQPEAVL